MAAEEAQRFRIFREKSGMSQEDIAKFFKIKQPAVSKYENGRADIPFRYIALLHEKMNLSYDWFYSGKGRMLDNDQEKSTLVRDLNKLEATQRGLLAKIEKMDDILHKLHSDFYALKK